MKDKIEKVLGGIAFASVSIFIIALIMKIWLGEEYQVILNKILLTEATLFFSCFVIAWLVNPSPADDEL